MQGGSTGDSVPARILITQKNKGPMSEKCMNGEKIDLRPGLKLHSPSPAPTPPPKNFLTAREFGKLLNISSRTFKRWKKAGRFPRPVRDSGWARWSRDEVLRWLRCGQPDQAVWDQLNLKNLEPKKGSCDEQQQQ